MIKIKKRKALAIVLTSTIIMQMFLTSVAFANGLSSIEKKITASFTSYVEEQQEKITITATSQADNVTITSIKLPDGSVVQENSSEYTATENGRYEFEVFYEETIEQEITSETEENIPFIVEAQNSDSTEDIITVNTENTITDAPKNSEIIVVKNSKTFTYEVTTFVEVEVEKNEEKNETEYISNVPITRSGAIVQSGTIGNVDWTLDDQGILNFGDGTFSDDFRWDSWGSSLSDSVKQVNFNDTVIAGNELSYMFYNFRILENINGLENLNTRNVTNMSYMFFGCESLKNLDLSNFRTNNVVTMYWMFSGCKSLKNLDLTNFNTSNVINMSAMFYNCQSLTSLDLSGFDTSSVSNMRSMFTNCNSLISLDLSNFSTRNVTNMSYMFNVCQSLTSLDLRNFDTRNATSNMNSFFPNTIKRLSLGNNFKFGSDALAKAPITLSETGNWQYIGTGSVTSPNGSIYTHPEFILYDGSQPGTYVLDILKEEKTVTFYTNGGTAIPPINIASGSTISKPSPDPTKDGYTFLKWTKSDGEKWNFENDIVIEDITLYAQWEEESVTEQFNLPLGDTYYFDLSDEVRNIGDINKGNNAENPFSSVPDTSLHYVPFTYIGTIDAYSLNSSHNNIITTDTIANNNKSLRNLFLSDYNIIYNVSWNDLNSRNLIFGKTFDTNYKLRSLSGGSNYKEWDFFFPQGGTPSSNEWDQIITKDTLTNPIKNWSSIYTALQDTTSLKDTTTLEENSYAMRGGILADTFFREMKHVVDGSIGWRPALEVLNTAELEFDGLKSIELNLNGGSFVNERDEYGTAVNTVTNINIICADDSFTATSNEGLTRPVGNTGTYFNWNTEANGSGVSYSVGDSVPSTVTTLYAQWEEESYSITVVNGTADKGTAAEGEVITLIADTAPSGKVFDKWISSDVTFENETVSNATFTMPAKAVTVTATYKNSGSSGGSGGGTNSKYYTITAIAKGNGNISPDGSITFREGSNKTFTIKPDEGFVIKEVILDGESIGAIETYTFKDIQKDHKIEAFFEKIDPNKDVNKVKPNLNKKEHFAYMGGYPDNTFAPNKNMTRAEVAVMFSRLLKNHNDIGTAYQSSFTDINSSNWYGETIGYMEQFGVLGGYPDGTFRPNSPITRAEFASIAVRFENIEEGKETNFIDLSKTHWAKRNIEKAHSRGLIGGYPDNTVKPDHFITRAEVTTVVNRLLERESDRGYIESNTSLLNLFNDVTENHWAYYMIVEASNGHEYITTDNGKTWTELKNK